ncbi:Gfo/Idh/MocA family oxidoreductase [Akkermansiaceae bacterium]|nr:Gfo/Idh/MocA family oxidoreductase [Akkermansiaceae bacterium]MDA8976927.1 Gfo/Idh/MocA family oxidoreductase [Akkermansiaceae bacterium]
MRIGVIGAGNWGINLVRNFSEMGVLAGVADAVPQNRQNALEIQPNVAIYGNHMEMLTDKFDAVAIATPAHTHYAIAKDAMEAGCDVFIEKPMTLDPSEAEALVESGREMDKIVMVGHLLLYQPAIAYLKKALGRGDIGQVYTFHQRRSKQGRARAVENVLWSFGVHDIAVLLYLAAQAPTEVQVSGHCGLQPDVEDDTYLHLTFPDGSKAHLHNSWLWPIVERGLIIIGEKGILRYDEIAQNIIFVKKTIDSDLLNVDEGEEVVFEGSGQPLRIELEHFVDCCKNRTKANSCGQNGLEVVRVINQAEALLEAQR